MVGELFPVDPANPVLTDRAVADVVRDRWGIDGSLRALGSLQDQNFAVRAADGACWVAKISGVHTPRESLDLQNAAMEHVAQRRDGFDSPRPVPTSDGDQTVDVDGLRLRLLTWVEGIPVSERSYLGPPDLVELGALAARVARAFEGFTHPSLALSNPWDVRVAGRVLAESRPLLPDLWNAYLDTAIAAFATVGEDADLPLAVVHGDLSPVNAVCLPDDSLRSRPVGVLDFGDVMTTWRIGDVCASAVGAVEHPGTGDPLDAVLAVLVGYHGVTTLTEAEIDAFWPLVLARAAVSAAMCQRQLTRNADNVYAGDGVQSGLRAMHRLATVPVSLARAAVRAVAGLPPSLPVVRVTAPVVELVDGVTDAPTVDLSTDGDLLTDGAWEDGASVGAAVRSAYPSSPVLVTGWGQASSVRSTTPTHEPPATLDLGVRVLAPAGTPVRLPVAGRVRSVGGTAGGSVVEVELAASDVGPVVVRLSGVTARPALAAGAALDAGAQLGVVAACVDAPVPPGVHVQLVLADGLPSHGLARHREVWRLLCPDPSWLLGRAPAPSRPDARVLQAEHDSVVARPQHLYYDRPPQIVRGWRHHLYDADGRCYLDMINNIAAVGHSHPRITAAATRQFRRLNTNSRFLYDSMTRYCERVAELLPPELGSVFLVNSGSEAADLALQLARRATGRQDVVALAGAYHGWTGAVIDVSTSPVDRPNWRTELPSWVHVAEQPDTYRGAFGADGEAYRASARAACAEAQPNGGVAAFVSEPLLGNQGALELPPGYLAGVYADVRAAGGVCVADEVQVGMARTGETFWAFEHEGAVPDIVYTAKATGNGHPLGVVACRREIADTFDGQTAYFSSTGGGPVSCEIGIAVLDVMRDEGLQQNALVVGRHLRERLSELGTRHELIGAVHGRGLYQGVDLVLDRELRTPARYEALAVSERLREVGVIMQPTGDAFNVLKVKPPLCLDVPAADYFVDALDHVLTEFT